MAEDKILNFPVKPNKGHIQWLEHLETDGIGYSSIGLDSRGKKYPWVIFTIGRTPKEAIELMMSAGESWSNEDVCIEVQAQLRRKPGVKS